MMAKKTAKKSTGRKKTSKKKKITVSPFKRRKVKDAFAMVNPEVHVYGKGHTCSTNTRGYPTPENRSPTELVLDASEGFIPLWAENVTLRWRFNEDSMRHFENPVAAKAGVRDLLGEAMLLWGDSAPVKLTETNDAWDFEIAVRDSDRCNVSGCTLASAFFPDAGRHELVLYPRMFTQSRKEQVDTFIHEIGHVFGLRHFFANIGERQWPSVIFGAHRPFGIMNYGHNSELTDDDRSDLRLLYTKIWGGELTEINGTRIVHVRPFHDLILSNVFS